VCHHDMMSSINIALACVEVPWQYPDNGMY
jgi:hypothetical protein